MLWCPDYMDLLAMVTKGNSILVRHDDHSPDAKNACLLWITGYVCVCVCVCVRARTRAIHPGTPWKPQLLPSSGATPRVAMNHDSAFYQAPQHIAG